LKEAKTDNEIIVPHAMITATPTLQILDVHGNHAKTKATTKWTTYHTHTSDARKRFDIAGRARKSSFFVVGIMMAVVVTGVSVL
jgi:hypothetical protein